MGYYYQTRNGKRVRVRKRRAGWKRDIAAGTKSAAASGGFVLGTGAGVAASRLAGNNPVAKVVLMSTGAIAGSTVANVLANRVLYKNKFNE